MKVAILVTDGFEQIELTSPREALEKAGIQTAVIAPKRGKVQGFKHHDKADRIDVDLELSRAIASDYDGVLLPGGVINGDALRIDKDGQRFVQEIDRAGKPVMVICHGGWILVSAGLVKGRTMTSWPTLEDDIRNAGGNWKDSEVIRDRNWVSSRKPDDLPAFNKAIVSAVNDRRSARDESRADTRDESRA
ncbi:MAG TPA: type 1 glutamine amidotransferase domain-containing protein [Thermoanaerobaculia bacterium]|jgi:protease I|nr:type 1 glutamine amidotransferase domain-containing protein [Thermoanaerobaculia bacterium]